MGVQFDGVGGGAIGSVTAAAGTGFYGLVPGSLDGKTRINSFGYTAGNTAHNVTFLRPIGRTTLAAACNANTNTVTLAADPGPSGNGVGANDQIVIHYRANTNDRLGTYSRHTVSAWDANTKVATITPNTTAASISGSKVWDYGVAADTDPATGTAHPYVTCPLSTTITPYFQGGGIGSHNYHEPILVYSANGTGAGTLSFVEYSYTKR